MNQRWWALVFAGAALLVSSLEVLPWPQESVAIVGPALRVLPLTLAFLSTIIAIRSRTAASIAGALLTLGAYGWVLMGWPTDGPGFLVLYAGLGLLLRGAVEGQAPASPR